MITTVTTTTTTTVTTVTSAYLALIAVVTLLVLLGLKEIVSSLDLKVQNGHLHRLNRVLNVAIVPLSVVFLAIGAVSIVDALR